jgi:hypothetical protein
VAATNSGGVRGTLLTQRYNRNVAGDRKILKAFCPAVDLATGSATIG